jgi:hypothetical protein
MPTVAKAPADTDIYTGGQHFVFGSDGARQVTKAEEDILRSYMANGGTVSIDFEESKPEKKGES